MEFCVIDDKSREYFEPFIARRYEIELTDKNTIALGIYDDRGVLGAAILRKNHAVMEILSLEYINDLEAGECEKELIEIIKKQDWDVYRIEYIVGAEKTFFDDYDFAMLDIGFIPSEGNVKKYHATLKEIAQYQGETLKLFEKKKDVSEFKIGKNLTNHDIDSYNNIYPCNRYRRAADNEELSCFMFKDGEVAAGILARDLGDGTLEFQWMDARELAIQEVMKLIVFTTVNALKKYSPSCEVIICPFTSEVEGLVTRFGFKESPEHVETRIYSYYL
ncbi:MAG: hypothetical protein K6C96_02000 [Butyrivibrio sp.]|nr:hypothetical protein [Butyrivibrio sp.]